MAPRAATPVKEKALKSHAKIISVTRRGIITYFTLIQLFLTMLWPAPIIQSTKALVSA